MEAFPQTPNPTTKTENFNLYFSHHTHVLNSHSVLTQSLKICYSNDTALASFIHSMPITYSNIHGLVIVLLNFFVLLILQATLGSFKLSHVRWRDILLLVSLFSLRTHLLFFICCFLSPYHSQCPRSPSLYLIFLNLCILFFCLF